ncbi:uncharacterized protein LOC123671361 [Harmonia axyridis]|uniref:uncharacterized protein LOC123671361 n=1 Tax=Harmonia axyridis TaxID=115357 RepID=UPI001E278A01|nr:uncharacterized protein LOC123671361 [Harmonia axyridis]
MDNRSIRNEIKEPICSCKTNRNYLIMLTLTIFLILFSEIFLSVFIYALRTELSKDTKSYQEKYEHIQQEISELQTKFDRSMGYISGQPGTNRKTRETYSQVPYSESYFEKRNQMVKEYSELCMVVKTYCPLLTNSISQDGHETSSQFAIPKLDDQEAIPGHKGLSDYHRN